VFLVVLTPPLSQGLLSHHGNLLNTAASADGLAVAPAALLAAVCLYTSWRLSSAASPSWIVACLALVGVQSVSFAGLQITDPARTAQQHAWMALADLVLLATLIAFRAYDDRGLLRRSPTAVGATAGALIGLLRVASVSHLPPIEPSVLHRAVVTVVGVSMAALLSWLVLRGGVLPRWIRVRFVVAVLLLCAGHTVTALDGAVRAPLNVLVALLCSAVAAAAMVSAAVGVLHVGLVEHARRTSTLLEKLEHVQEDHRTHRARMHELESTIAGIRSAGELLKDEDRIGPERRRQLEEMIHSEVCRLERLLTSQPLADEDPVQPVHSLQPVTVSLPTPVAEKPTHQGSVDLDAAIATLALIHEAKGTSVRWIPSGRRVRACADDVTEVLNTLLDNAARHGDAAPSVTVRDAAEGTPGIVEILVSDQGPGIAPEVRDRLFQWGAHASSSPGQGIGLHIAQTLAARQGGYLRLQDAPDGGRGATFVLGLPAAPVPVVGVVVVPAARARENDGVLA